MVDWDQIPKCFAPTQCTPSWGLHGGGRSSHCKATNDPDARIMGVPSLSMTLCNLDDDLRLCLARQVQSSLMRHGMAWHIATASSSLVDLTFACVQLLMVFNL